MKAVKEFIRPVWVVVWLGVSFVYDFYRFSRHANYFGATLDTAKRDFLIRKASHSIEKALSIYGRIKSESYAEIELRKLLASRSPDNQSGIDIRHARNLLHEVSAFKNADDDKYIHGRQPEVNDSGEARAGVRRVDKNFLLSGVLDEPETFFSSRMSVRDYTDEVISTEVVKRAIKLASKTPSVCNRQAWHVYHIDQPSQIQRCLSVQNGNSGFSNVIHNLFLVAVNLKAFTHAGERHQHWIDGGMFAMSLVYAFHSLGIATCCLNWSKGPLGDLKLRGLHPIKSEHSIVMMIAAGVPKDRLVVCESPRGPVHQYYTHIDE